MIPTFFVSTGCRTWKPPTQLITWDFGAHHTFGKEQLTQDLWGEKQWSFCLVCLVKETMIWICRDLSLFSFIDWTGSGKNCSFVFLDRPWFARIIFYKYSQILVLVINGGRYVIPSFPPINPYSCGKPGLQCFFQITSLQPTGYPLPSLGICVAMVREYPWDASCRMFLVACRMFEGIGTSNIRISYTSALYQHKGVWRIEPRTSSSQYIK